jgi:hypothetical protein
MSDSACQRNHSDAWSRVHTCFSEHTHHAYEHPQNTHSDKLLSCVLHPTHHPRVCLQVPLLQLNPAVGPGLRLAAHVGAGGAHLVTALADAVRYGCWQIW